MAQDFVLIDYLLKALVTLLMERHHMSYDEALSTVLSSETYKKIVRGNILTSESPLYVLSILEKELYFSIDENND